MSTSIPSKTEADPRNRSDEIIKRMQRKINDAADKYLATGQPVKGAKLGEPLDTYHRVTQNILRTRNSPRLHVLNDAGFCKNNTLYSEITHIIENLSNLIPPSPQELDEVDTSGQDFDMRRGSKESALVLLQEYLTGMNIITDPEKEKFKSTFGKDSFDEEAYQQLVELMSEGFEEFVARLPNYSWEYFNWEK